MSAYSSRRASQAEDTEEGKMRDEVRDKIMGREQAPEDSLSEAEEGTKFPDFPPMYVGSSTATDATQDADDGSKAGYMVISSDNGYPLVFTAPPLPIPQAEQAVKAFIKGGMCSLPLTYRTLVQSKTNKAFTACCCWL